MSQNDARCEGVIWLKTGRTDLSRRLYQHRPACYRDPGEGVKWDSNESDLIELHRTQFSASQ